ncbi:MAG TPA: sulfite exporter TauE/SafE family protein, partial [Saprospiraceae bacterium]|nr:sulfite exporter TauE/SafE family protein [Saprospiraceae bacterium]
MEIIGYACALLVGISLGVLGSGGSILTVPILVYLLNVNPVEATGYSLFVVGFTSAIGCATYVRKKLVDMRVALIFAMPSIAFVFLTRRFLMPLIPDTVISLPSFTLSKAFAIMILYALLMVAAAVSMIFQPKDRSTKENPNRITNYPGLMAIGAVCGILTGIFGVGGGF